MQTQANQKSTHRTKQKKNTVDRRRREDEKCIFEDVKPSTPIPISIFSWLSVNYENYVTLSISLRTQTMYNFIIISKHWIPKSDKNKKHAEPMKANRSRGKKRNYSSSKKRTTRKLHWHTYHKLLNDYRKVEICLMCYGRLKGNRCQMIGSWFE